MTRRCTLFAALLAASLAALATLRAADTSPTRPATAPAATRPARLQPAFAALAYYDASCARCHGPQGSFYGPDLGRHLSDAQLIKVVRDMAQGPGGAPLDDAGLAAETAFHRALIAGTPFLSVTRIAPGQLEGEVMPDATVTLTFDRQTLTTDVDGSTWTAHLPPTTDPARITLTATRDHHTTTLHLARSETFSHAAPVPAQTSTPAGGAAAGGHAKP